MKMELNKKYKKLIDADENQVKEDLLHIITILNDEYGIKMSNDEKVNESKKVIIKYLDIF